MDPGQRVPTEIGLLPRPKVKIRPSQRLRGADEPEGQPVLLKGQCESSISISEAAQVLQREQGPWFPWLSGTFGGCGGSNASRASAGQSGPAAEQSCGSAGNQEVTTPQGARDCPICYEAISLQDAALSCTGAGGMHHYFHKECLGNWIRVCRQNHSGPTCPVCRGAVHVNVKRLSAYLESPQAAAMPVSERGVLENLLTRARATLGTCSEADGEWADPFTAEDVSYVGMLGLATTVGFWAGYSDNAIDDLLLLAMAPADGTVRAAESIGYIAGLTTHVVQTLTQS